MSTGKSNYASKKIRWGIWGVAGAQGQKQINREIKKLIIRSIWNNRNYTRAITKVKITRCGVTMVWLVSAKSQTQGIVARQMLQQARLSAEK